MRTLVQIFFQQPELKCAGVFVEATKLLLTQMALFVFQDPSYTIPVTT